MANLVTASQARAGLYRLIDETAESHQPIMISGKRSNAVLVSPMTAGDSRDALFAVGARHARIDQEGHGRAALEKRQETHLVKWEIVFAKAAVKDARNSRRLASKPRRRSF